MTISRDHRDGENERAILHRITPTSALLRGTRVLLCLITLASCSEDPTTAVLTPHVAPSAILPVTGSCGACVYGPRQLTVGSGTTRAEVRAVVKGDPNGSYMLVARALTARARLEVLVDGVVVLTRAATEQAGLTEITRPVRIRKESDLIVRVFGPAGSGGEVAILGGATTLDATGGTVVSPKTGARVSVAAGVLSGAAVVTLRDQPLRSPIHSSISAVASRFMLSGLAAQTIGAGNISIDLPLSRPPQQGATLVLRGDFEGVNADPVWRDGTYDAARRVFVVTGSAQSFVQQSPMLGDSLAVALSVEEYVPPGVGTVSRVSANVTPPTGTTSICQLNPFSGLTQLYGDGLGDQSAPSIWYDASGPSLATAGQAIVLIHGWSKWQTNCSEYRGDERVDEYFKDLIASLRAPTNGLSNIPVLLVDYPTYNAYASSAADLAPGLDKIAVDFGLDFVVVAHSMGGLVARAATHFENRQPLAIITLDTPHLGTPAASNTGFWSLAQNSPALAGLASGLTHASSEPRLIAYGSRVTFTPHPIGNGGLRSYTTDAVPQYWSAAKYHLPGGWLCDGGDCVNDGIVPDWSSLPSFVPAADQRAFVGFDHTFMRGAGGFPPGVESGLIADIKSFLTGVPSAPTALSALVTGSHTVTLSWTDNSSDEDKFIVESATDPSGPFVEEGETPANGTRIDLLVVPAVVTYYRVSAERGGLRSGVATTSATPLAEFPSRGVSATAVWNGRLLTFGVSPNGYSSGRTFSYDPSSDVWTEQRYFGGAPLTIGGYSGVSGAALLGGSVYVTGGSGWGFTYSVLNIFDPAANSWTQGPDHPIPTAGGLSGVINGKLYVYTPTAPSGATGALHVFDPTTQQWTALTPPPHPHGGAGGVIGGQLYLVGGSYSNSAIDVYDPATDSWSDGGRIPTARDLPAVAVDGTKLYVVGGYVPCPVQCRFIGDVEVLDVAAGGWTRLAPLKTPRALPGLAVLGNRVYVVSGTVGNSGLAGDQTTSIEWFPTVP